MAVSRTAEPQAKEPPRWRLTFLLLGIISAQWWWLTLRYQERFQSPLPGATPTQAQPLAPDVRARSAESPGAGSPFPPEPTRSPEEPRLLQSDRVAGERAMNLVRRQHLNRPLQVREPDGSLREIVVTQIRDETTPPFEGRVRVSAALRDGSGATGEGDLWVAESPGQVDRLVARLGSEERTYVLGQDGVFFLLEARALSGGTAPSAPSPTAAPSSGSP